MPKKRKGWEVRSVKLHKAASLSLPLPLLLVSEHRGRDGNTHRERERRGTVGEEKVQPPTRRGGPNNANIIQSAPSHTHSLPVQAINPDPRACRTHRLSSDSPSSSLARVCVPLVPSNSSKGLLFYRVTSRRRRRPRRIVSSSSVHSLHIDTHTHTQIHGHKHTLLCCLLLLLFSSSLTLGSVGFRDGSVRARGGEADERLDKVVNHQLDRHDHAHVQQPGAL